MAVDSGATETVTGGDMLTTIPNTSPPRKGIFYETADGTDVAHMVAKKFVAEMEGGMARGMEAQIAEGLNKGLLSVPRLMDTDHIVVFDNDGSYILDKTRGEYAEMHKSRSGLMVLKIWCKKTDGFYGRTITS